MKIMWYDQVAIIVAVKVKPTQKCKKLQFLKRPAPQKPVGCHIYYVHVHGYDWKLQNNYWMDIVVQLFS